MSFHIPAHKNTRHPAAQRAIWSNSVPADGQPAIDDQPIPGDEQDPRNIPAADAVILDDTNGSATTLWLAVNAQYDAEDRQILGTIRHFR